MRWRVFLLAPTRPRPKPFIALGFQQFTRSLRPAVNFHVPFRCTNVAHELAGLVVRMIDMRSETRTDKIQPMDLCNRLHNLTSKRPPSRRHIAKSDQALSISGLKG